MQYILTEEEYLTLVNASVNAKAKVVAVVQDLCIRVANHEPVIVDTGTVPPQKMIWGCLLTKGADFYCDHCPVREVCPYEGKTYSK